MKCKYCQAELEDGSSICPACGRDNEAIEVAPIEQIPEDSEPSASVTPEEEPAVLEEDAPVQDDDAESVPAEEEPPREEPEAPARQKMSAGKLTLVIVLAVVAVAILVALIWASVSDRSSTDPTEPTDNALSSTDVADSSSEPTAAATIPADGDPDNVTCKGSYTVSDEEVIAARDVVVATVGDQELTNGMLQIYYWMAFYDFMDNYSAYASYFGLDYTQPLDTQSCGLIDGTWQQYFLGSAILSWQRYQSLALQAEENGFILSQEYQDYLDSVETSLESSAQSYGFASAQEMLESDVGAGGTVEDYLQYLALSYQGYQFYSSEYEKIANPTEEEIETYFNENEETFAQDGITKDMGNYVDVRHILIAPEGGTTDESGNTTYSDEEWAACEQSAQDVLDSWLAGEQTEDSFASLANIYSVDGGSNTNGGLYTNIYAGSGMVQEFEDWCVDESRQVGDTGLVKSQFGYHVMYFSASRPIWLESARSALLEERSSAIIDAAVAAYPTTVNYSAIVLGFVNQVRTS